MNENDIIDLDSSLDGVDDDLLSIEELLLLGTAGTLQAGIDFLDLDGPTLPHRSTGINVNDGNSRTQSNKEAAPSSSTNQASMVPDDTSSLDAALNAKIAVEASLTMGAPPTGDPATDDGSDDGAPAADATAQEDQSDDTVAAPDANPAVDPLADEGDIDAFADGTGAEGTASSDDDEQASGDDGATATSIADTLQSTDEQTADVQASTTTTESVEPGSADVSGDGTDSIIVTDQVDAASTGGDPLSDQSDAPSSPAPRNTSEPTNLDQRRGNGDPESESSYTASGPGAATDTDDDAEPWQGLAPEEDAPAGDGDSEEEAAAETPVEPEEPGIDRSLWSTSVTMEEDGTLLITRAMLADGASDLVGMVGDRWVDARSAIASAQASFNSLKSSAASSLSRGDEVYQRSSLSEMLGDLSENGVMSNLGHQIVSAQSALDRAQSRLSGMGEQPTAASMQFSDLSVDQGTLIDNGNGTWAFTPDADWNGDLNINYDAVLGRYSSPEILGVEVAAVNDAAAVEATTATLDEDGSLTITQAMLLDGASDVEGDALTALNLSARRHAHRQRRRHLDVHARRGLERRPQRHLRRQRWHGDDAEYSGRHRHGGE